MSLRNRLILSSVVVMLPIMLAIVIFFASEAAEAKKDIMNDMLADVTTSMGDSALRWDQFMQSTMESLAGQTDIISMDATRAKDALRRMNRVFDRLDVIQITSITGQAVARSDDYQLLNYADRYWFRTIQKTREPAHDVVVSRINNRTTAVLATPIFNGEQMVGMVVVGIELAKLRQEIGAQQLGHKSNSYLIDEKGIVLYHPNSEFINSITNLSDTEPVRSVLAGKVGPFSYSDIHGSAKHVYALRLANGWSVITEQDQSVLKNEIAGVWKGAAIIALLAGVLITGLQWMMASYIVKPINKIREAAKEVSSGNWSVQAPVLHRDEVGALAETFNIMTSELRRSYQTVEEKVKERTSELARSNEELITARKAAEHANSTKDDFLTNVSHELRTPLTAVLGYTELMLDPATAPEMPQDTLRSIRSNAMHLLQIVNDILDYSKIVTGGMTVDPQPCNLINIVREVIDCIMPRAKAKSLKFDAQVDPDLPPVIMTDALRLKQSLINLLSNAVKFTSQGSVELKIFGEGENENRVLYMTIHDTGVGIPPDHLPNLFKGFSQADPSRSRRFGGTGLGLSIAHGFISLLGGHIIAESKLGMGSTFTVCLPLRTPQPTAPAAPRTPEQKATEMGRQLGGTLDGMKILLVEDGIDNQRLISMVLKKAGASVELAENGSIALDKLEKSKFDAVLMDMQMPVMDGYTATRTLRTRGYTTPVIAVTAHAMAEDRAKCLASGCDDYMVKPIDRTKLINCIREHLNQQKN